MRFSIGHDSLKNPLRHLLAVRLRPHQTGFSWVRHKSSLHQDRWGVGQAQHLKSRPLHPTIVGRIRFGRHRRAVYRLGQQKVVVVVTVARPDLILISNQRSPRRGGRRILGGKAVRLPPVGRSTGILVKMDAYKNKPWPIIRQFGSIRMVQITILVSGENPRNSGPIQKFCQTFSHIQIRRFFTQAPRCPRALITTPMSRIDHHPLQWTLRNLRIGPQERIEGLDQIHPWNQHFTIHSPQ